MNIRDVSTEELLNEITRRNGHVHPDDALAPAHAMIDRLCVELAFTPPRVGESIVDWADTVLDSPLAPRGGQAWGSGHAHLIDAIEAALAGNELIARASVSAAREVVKAHGNRFCECVTKLSSMRDATTGRQLCMQCRLRRR